jgi:hypothetical protein
MEGVLRVIEHFGLRPGDLLLCGGGEVGRAAFWQGQLDERRYQKALHDLRVDNVRQFHVAKKSRASGVNSSFGIPASLARR